MRKESKKSLVLNIGFFFLFIVDRVFKWLAYNKLPVSGPIEFLNFFRLELYLNDGIIFSIPLYQPMIYMITIIIIGILIFYLYKAYLKSNYYFIVGLSLIIVGAFSNLLDRINYGAIIDFVNLIFLPIFNLADLLIVIGTLVLIIKIPNTNKNEKIYQEKRKF